ncbi:hypothetical protein [Paraliomyxa miuraensis]|uniref:hypothetical protein n=1 Tax=Paraliomyxa miuraensis TaxID=376150 RepID=UPI002257320F|nr:hypothetical protein [Paraliomyxa miuraensis]MCX4242905.1 hypothetical protein [Paraliomyxa miuraensis]
MTWWLPTTARCGLVLAFATACRPAPPPPATDDTTSGGPGSATDPMGTTFAAPDACQSSEECETEGLCVAPYDPGGDPPLGGCIEACIEVDDITRWCFDDASCCGNARCHEVDGLCEPGPSASSSSSSTGTDTGSSSGTDGTGSTTDGSGSSGSGSSGTSSSTG